MTDMVHEEGGMRSRTDFPSSESSDRCRSVRLSSGFCSLRRSLRYRARHSGDSDDIARGHDQLEVLIDPSQSPVHGLPDAAHGLAPAEVLLDALSDRLAQRIRSVSRRAPINRAAAAARVVARHMRDNVSHPAGVDAVLRVIGLVRPDALW